MNKDEQAEFDNLAWQCYREMTLYTCDICDEDLDDEQQADAHMAQCHTLQELRECAG